MGFKRGGVMDMRLLNLLPLREDEFIKWYHELGKLKIFWAKPVLKTEWLQKSEKYLLRIIWKVRNKEKEAMILSLKEWRWDGSLQEILSKFRNMGKIVLTLNEIPVEYTRAKPYVWFWKLEDAPLKGNMAVEIKIYHKWTEEDLKQSMKRAGDSSCPQGMATT